MGKIVKYCQSCDESFAEKFGFCPNCGNSMQAFEMNPVGGGMTSVSENKAATVSPVAPAKIEPVKVSEPATVAAVVPVAAANASENAETISKPVSSDASPIVPQPQAPAKETKTFAASNGGFKSQTSNDGYRTVESQPNGGRADGGGFNITFVEERNAKQRNMLLLGSLMLMLTIAAGAMVYSLFNYTLSVAAIGDETGLSMAVIEDVPMQVEDVPKPKLDKNAGGGGGGGGRNDPDPVSKGELPPQFKEKPLLTPSKEDISVTNPAIRVMRATQGPDDIIPKNRSATNGDPNSTNTNPSNGHSLAGTGMGINGKDGIGNNGENGYGANGKGGRGLSTGSQYGNDPGEGGRVAGNNPPPPPEPKAAVTEPLKIISRPKPPYTDAARTNQVTGVVRVRVTFLPSGQIGSVSPVSGLPYGLTEQAIAAAKSIKFEPQKRNGVAVGTTKVIEYSFTIY